MHVDDWKIPHQQIGYQDSAGAISVVSDGTRAYLQNRNAAGSGKYPSDSFLLLGRGFRWITWAEAPHAAGVVTTLTEAEVRALFPFVSSYGAAAVPAAAVITAVTDAPKILVEFNAQIELRDRNPHNVVISRGGNPLRTWVIEANSSDSNRNDRSGHMFRLVDEPGSAGPHSYTVTVAAAHAITHALLTAEQKG